ncbi:DUF2505 domain-containing protein [Mycolicibacterium elephantis]|uniref:DUF2505 domain-containing protein n=1 Tax=Mycolicibacterium elephantis DSM 44368 TaxID=1335622 RepID=A0A439DSB2_9MYCO|nr:DUF2505 domain-containing protein [Mycolicibacterium elephantis]MCV7223757.1 DUF2505 domain-containing protein [Mycolicibacterium elephantis]RWA19118.1 hypothetical protein MELE44368_22550 [Mycolicibacterium elephantis DSM 44368]
MSHSFDIVTESPVSVEQIHAAFGREDYWQARLADGAGSALESLLVDEDGVVDVRITQHLGRQVLPAAVARVLPGDLKLQYRETWRTVGDGRVSGVAEASASGGLGSSRAENLLAPAGTASQLRSAVRVDVKIPFAGGQLEKVIGSSLANSIPEVLRFTTSWISAHA